MKKDAVIPWGPLKNNSLDLKVYEIGINGVRTSMSLSRAFLTDMVKRNKGLGLKAEYDLGIAILYKNRINFILWDKSEKGWTSELYSVSDKQFDPKYPGRNKLNANAMGLEAIQEFERSIFEKEKEKFEAYLDSERSPGDLENYLKN